MAATFRLVVNLTARTTAFERSIRGLERSLNRFERRVTDVGRSLTIGLTAPILGVATAAGRMSASFEESLTKMVGLVGIARKDVEGLGEEILGLAPQVGRSPKELAEAMFFITSAGLRGKTAVDALRVSAKAAAAGLGQITNVADAVTSAVNAYGEANLSAAMSTSILVATVREGKASAESLAPVFGRVIPTAAELGVTFDQVGAALAAMTRIGFSADEAATALRAVFTTLLKPSMQAEKALGEVGMRAADLRRQLKEKGLISVLGSLRQAFEGNDDAITKVFPNVRALSGIFALTGENAENTRKIFASLAQTTTETLNTAFSEAEKDAMFRFNKVMAEIRVTAVKLGNEILVFVAPALEYLGGKVQAVSRWFSGLSEQQKALVIVVGALAAALGPLLLALGIAAGSLSTMLSMARLLAPAFTVLLGAITPLSGAALLLGASAVVVFVQWKKMAEGIGVIVDWLGSKLKSTNDRILDFLADMVEANPQLRAMGVNVENLAEKIRKSNKQIADGETLGQKLTAFYLGLGESAKAGVGDAIESIRGGLSGLADLAGETALRIKESFGGIATAQMAAAEAMGSVREESLEDLVDYFTALEESMSVWERFKASATDAWAGIKDASVRAGLILEKQWSQYEAQLKGIGSATAQSLGALTAAFAKGEINVKSFVKSMIVEIGKLLAKIAILKALTTIGLGGPFAGGFINAMFRQHGGRVTPGRAYVVGERRPELFVPDTSGTIVPSLESPAMPEGRGTAGGTVIHNTFHITVKGGRNGRETAREIVEALTQAFSAPDGPSVTLANRITETSRRNSTRAS